MSCDSSPSDGLCPIRWRFPCWISHGSRSAKSAFHVDLAEQSVPHYRPYRDRTVLPLCCSANPERPAHCTLSLQSCNSHVLPGELRSSGVRVQCPWDSMQKHLLALRVKLALHHHKR